MKIRKFNENIEIKEYIKDCFIDFHDRDILDIDDIDSENNSCYLFINLPWVDNNGSEWVFKKPSTIKDMIKYSTDLKEYYEELYVSIKKTKIKYPNLTYTIGYEWEEGYVKFGDDEFKENFDAYLTIEIFINDEN